MSTSPTSTRIISTPWSVPTEAGCEGEFLLRHHPRSERGWAETHPFIHLHNEAKAPGRGMPGVGMVKPTPATHPALMERFPSWLRSTEVLPQSMSFNPHAFFALPQVATNIVKGGEISPAYLKSSHSLCLHDPRERDNKFHG